MTPALSISVNKGKSLLENDCIATGKDTVKVVSSQEVLGKNFTIYGTRENPLFLAKDVAEWIEHSNLTMMIQSVDDDESITLRTKDSLGRDNSATFLTENGLYEVLMLSRKPIAKEFKKEVKKILKEIRLTGGYTVPNTFAQALRLAAEQQERIEAQQALIEEQTPKVNVYDNLVDRSKMMNFRDFAPKVGMTQTQFMNLLKTKYIYKNSVGEYRAYAEYNHLFDLRTFSRGVDKTGEQLMLNMEGIKYFLNMFNAETIADKWLESEEAV